MAISPYVWMMIIVSSVVAIGSLTFLIIMIWNFFKKKTIGTALLAMFYGMIALYHLVHSIMMSIAAQNPFSLSHKISYVIYVVCLFLNYYFLYMFGTRHILRDNDVTKTFVSIVMLALNGAIVGMMAYELFTNVENPLLYVLDPKTDWGITHYVPTTIVTLSIYLTCVLFVQIRIIISISATLIRKEIENDIQRKGLAMILFGILSLFGSVLLTVIISIPNTGNFVFTSLYILRGIMTLLGLFLSYVGWILPNWFRKRVRKAWIVSQVTVGKEIKIPYTSSKTIKIKEVADE
jgi:hypothetical protein